MRYLVLVAVGCLVVTGMVGNAAAVGLERVGEEDCHCSPLVANGVVPDFWNQLAMLFTVPELNQVIDETAVDLKAVLDQFGLDGRSAVASAVAPPSPKETENISPEPKKEEKKTAPKKHAARTGRTRIKPPPKAPSNK